MAPTGPIPGSTPINVPRKQPAKTRKRFSGRTATDKPYSKPLNASTISTRKPRSKAQHASGKRRSQQMGEQIIAQQNGDQRREDNQPRFHSPQTEQNRHQQKGGDAIAELRQSQRNRRSGRRSRWPHCADPHDSSIRGGDQLPLFGKRPTPSRTQEQIARPMADQKRTKPGPGSWSAPTPRRRDDARTKTAIRRHATPLIFVYPSFPDDRPKHLRDSLHSGAVAASAIRPVAFRCALIFFQLAFRKSSNFWPS